MRARHRLLALALGALMTLGALPPGPAAAGMDWQADPSRPQFRHLTAVTYGDKQFVAVGEQGALITSADGERWQARQSGATENLNGVAYGNGVYVATGGPYIQKPFTLTSPDGATWTRHEIPELLTAVAFCGTEFWATVPYPAGLAHSTDGVTWKVAARAQNTALPLNRIACGGGTVVAATVGRDVSDRAVAAWDGKTLTTQTLPDYQELYTVAYGDGKFVLLGYGGGTSAVSTDGKSWIRSKEEHGFLTGLVYANGRWTGTSFSGSATSTDGLTWQQQSDSPALAGALAYGDGRYVGVGVNGLITHSTDGLTWKHPDSRYDTALVYSSGLFVALGQSQDQSGSFTVASVSADGLAWQTRRLAPAGTTPVQLFYDYAGQRFVAVVAEGGRRSLYTSTDGAAWEGPVALPTLVAGVTEGEGEYLAAAPAYQPSAVGGDTSDTTVTPARIYHSRDLVTWAPMPSPASQPVALAYGAGTYLLTAQELDPNGGRWIAGPPLRSVLYTSTDGKSWTRREGAPGWVVPCDGRFVAPDGRSSVDGITWTEPAPGGGGWGLTCSQGRLLAMHGPSELVISVDGGMTWGVLEPALGSDITAAAIGNGRLVTVGTAPVATTLRCADLPDVANTAPACGPLKELVARGVLNGFPGGLMKPEGTVTRAQLAKMIVLSLGRSPDKNGTAPFGDAATHWSVQQGWLQAVHAMGAINGYPDGTFRPDGQVTRAELIKIVAAAAGLSNSAPTMSYTDVPDDAWYGAWVSKALAARIIGPDARVTLWADSRLSPDQAATRAEAAMLLSNLLQFQGK